MGQQPMHRRFYLAYAIAVVVAAVAIGYTVYANHSTISSLKSELSIKDQTIADNDTLIQEQKDKIAEQTATIAKQATYIATQDQKLEEKNNLLKQDHELITKLKEDMEDLKKARMSELQKHLDSLKTVSYGDSGWTITFYNANVESTGKRPGTSGYGVTASGAKVQDGVTVSCPKTIKLGTKVQIDGIGTRTCQDRGGGVNGKHLDVYVDAPRSTLLKAPYGTKYNVKVKVLGPAV